MKLSIVHHISLNVSDNKSARDFYIDILGFEPLKRPDFDFDGSWLKIGDQQLHLLETENHVAPVGQHFAFKVVDINEYRDYLIDKGIQVSKPSELKDIAWQCFFKDPAGNLLELNQPL